MCRSRTGEAGHKTEARRLVVHMSAARLSGYKERAHLSCCRAQYCPSCRPRTVQTLNVWRPMGKCFYNAQNRSRPRAWRPILFMIMIFAPAHFVGVLSIAFERVSSLEMIEDAALVRRFLFCSLAGQKSRPSAHYASRHFPRWCRL